MENIKGKNIDVSFISPVIGFMLKRKIEVYLSNSPDSYTDGKSITIGYSEDIKRLSLMEQKSMLLALSVHEAQHILSSSFNERKKLWEWAEKEFSNKVNSNLYVKMFMDMQNIIEDGRIENISAKNYIGTKKHLLFLNLYHWKNEPKHANFSPEKEINLFLQGVWSLAKLGILPKEYDTYPEDVKREILKNKDKIHQGVVARNCKLATDISKEIILNSLDFLEERIAKIKPSPINPSPETDYSTSDEQQEQRSTEHVMSINKSKQQKKQKEKDDDNKEKSVGNKSGKEEKEQSEEGKTHQDNMTNQLDEKKDEDDVDDGENKEKEEKEKGKDGLSGGAEGEEGEKTKKNNEEGKHPVDLADLDLDIEQIQNNLMEEIKKDIEQKEKVAQKNNNKSNDKEDHSNDEGTEVDIFRLLGKRLPDLDKLKGIKLEESHSIKDKKIQLVSLPPEMKRKGDRFRGEIEEILKKKAQDTLFEQREGILDPENLVKTSFSKDVFIKERINDLSDLSFYILKDNSGSMHGQKDKLAFEALSIIEEGLKSFPLKIVQFSWDPSDNTVSHEVIKDWNDKNKGDKNYSYSKSIKNYTMGANIDGIDILWATDEMLKRPEKDKVLIVLSDGLPHDIELTKKAISSARKNGVAVIGIFFEAEENIKSCIGQYQYMYEKNIIATQPQKIFASLKKTIINIIK